MITASSATNFSELKQKKNFTYLYKSPQKKKFKDKKKKIGQSPGLIDRRRQKSELLLKSEASLDAIAEWYITS